MIETRELVNRLYAGCAIEVFAVTPGAYSDITEAMYEAAKALERLQAENDQLRTSARKRVRGRLSATLDYLRGK